MMLLGAVGLGQAYQIRSPSGVISIGVTAAEDRILSERAAVNQRLKKVAKYAAQPLGQHTQTSVRPARTLSFFILGQKINFKSLDQPSNYR